MNLCKGLTKKFKTIITSSVFAVVLAVSAVGGIFIHNNIGGKNNGTVPGSNNVNNFEDLDNDNYAVETDGQLNYVLTTDTENIAQSFGVTEYYTVVGARDKNATSINIPQLFNEKYVFSIGYKAFDNMRNLESIFIHEKMLKIEDCAFYDCVNLSSVTLFDCLISIGDYAFRNCYNLRVLNIPQSVTHLGEGMVYGCNLLNVLTVDENNTVYNSKSPDGTEMGCITDKDITTMLYISRMAEPVESITTLGSRAFAGMSFVSHIRLPEGFTTIGDYAFEGCYNMTQADLPSTLKEVGIGIFSNCENLAAITIDRNNDNLRSRDLNGNETNSIMNYYANVVMVGCKNTIVANTVTKIGEYAFYNCIGLTELNLPENVKSIDNYAYYGCVGLKKVSIPETITSIGKGVFEYCLNIDTVELPTSINSISDYAFLGCSKLSSVTISNSVEFINSYAFYNCISLNNLTIPNSVTNIADGAFGGCDNLTNVIIESSDIYHEINGNIFKNILTFKINSNIDDGTNSYLDNNFESYVSSDNYNTYKLNYNLSIDKNVVVRRNGIALTSSTPIHFGDVLNISYTEDFGYHLQTFKVNDKQFEDNNISYSVTGDTKITFVQANNQATYKFYMDDKSTLLFTEVVYHGNNIIVSDPSKDSDGINIYEFDYWATSSGEEANLINISVPSNNSIVKLYAVFIITQVTEKTCLEFEEDENGNLFVVGFTEEVEHLIIPETYNDKPVVGIREWVFANCNSLITVVISDNVIEIGNYAFSDCQSLLNVHLGYSVENISEYAFYQCTNLKHVNIPDNVINIGIEAFAYCNNLISVDINFETSKLESIQDGAFEYCFLTSFTIPYSVKYIGSGVFDGCDNLTSLSICSNDLQNFDSSSFDYIYNNLKFLTLRTSNLVDYFKDILNSSSFVCLKIEQQCDDGSLEYYGSKIDDGSYNVYSQKFDENYDYLAFTEVNHDFGYGLYITGITVNLDEMQDIYIPSYFQGQPVLGIADGVASGFTDLRSLDISNEIGYIGANAFTGCTNLVSVTFDEGNYLSYIGDYAFAGCENLLSIRTPKFSVVEFGNSVFEGCANLVSAAINTETISECMFYHCISLLAIDMRNNVKQINSSGFKSCEVLSSINWSDKLTEIGDSAFADCRYLSLLNLPNSLIYIREFAFERCENISEIKFPNSLNFIGGYAFESCANIYKLEIPSNVTTIEAGAFESCVSISIIKVDPNNSVFTSRDYSGEVNAIIEISTEELIVGCKNTVIPTDGSVTSIGNNAFSGISDIKTIVIPSNITSIGIYAFYYNRFTEVTINSAQIYNASNGTGANNAGSLLNKATTVKVLKTIVDNSANTNSYLNNTSYFNRISDGDYYVYIKR